MLLCWRLKHFVSILRCTTSKIGRLACDAAAGAAAAASAAASDDDAYDDGIDADDAVLHLRLLW